MNSTLAMILILLTCAVMAVALFRTARLPSMLAYILIGLLLGPHATGLLPDSEANKELAEFGIVFLMFSIGLEFSLPQLMSMRRTVFGLGGLQVLLTLLVTQGIGMALGLDWREALVVAGALTMSSTAIVSKMLVEKVEINSRHGKLAIGVLLFQDLAVVPLLILIPGLSAPAETLALTITLSLLKAALTLWVLLALGKKLINPWFDLVARQRSRELFVMNVLMVTLLLAVVTQLAGLSYALGAFVAGMLISETRYRYQVEADIAPFRDILLGLFFVTMGMQLDLSALANQIGWVMLLLVTLILVKAVIIIGITRRFRHETGVAIRTGVMLAQAGEFSFVVLALGAEHALLGGQALQIVLAASLLSMILAPFIIERNGKFASRLSRSYEQNRDRAIKDIESLTESLHDHVILCGFGRSGQYLSRFLIQENIPFIALDIDSIRVREAAAAGENVVYGDAGRRVVLKAAGADRAKALVITYAEERASLKVLHVLQEHYPQLPVIVRTLDDSNLERFVDAGATEVVPEVLEGSLMLASHALILMGVPLSRVVKRIRIFRDERYQMFRGFFRGLSDHDLEREEDQIRLQSVALSANAFAVGKRLIDLWLEGHDVQVKTLRRRNVKHQEPSPDTVLVEDDILVLQGTPEKIAAAESYLLTGK